MWTPRSSYQWDPSKGEAAPGSHSKRLHFASDWSGHLGLHSKPIRTFVSVAKATKELWINHELLPFTWAKAMMEMHYHKGQQSWLGWEVQITFHNHGWLQFILLFIHSLRMTARWRMGLGCVLTIFCSCLPIYLHIHIVKILFHRCYFQCKIIF